MPRKSQALNDRVTSDLTQSSSQVRAPRCSLQPSKPSAKPSPNVPFRINSLHQGGGFMSMNLATLTTIEENQQAERDERDERDRVAAGGRNVGAAKSMSLIPVLAEEGEETSYPIKLQLGIWMDAFEQERRVYRSLVIASELLLQRVADCCAQQRQPNVLTTATALIVLVRFIPLLGPYADLVRGIVEELGHVLFISPSKSMGLSTSTSTFCRKTYFESFNDVVKAYRFHFMRSKKFGMMMDRETRVLDRAVFVWQKSVCRKMLEKWSRYTQRQKQLRLKYRKLFKKATSGAVVQRAVVAWRQYAHKLHLAVVESKNSRVVEELNIAYHLKRQAQERLAEAQSLSVATDIQLKDLTADMLQMRKTIAGLTATVSTEKLRFDNLKTAWLATVNTMFGDAHVIPAGGNYSTFLSEILLNTETVAPEHATRAGVSRRPSVNAKTKITPSTLFHMMWALSETSRGSQKSDILNQSAGGKPNELAEKICTTYRMMTDGVPPPIVTSAIVRSDQHWMRCFVLSVMELYGGGSLGLFFPCGNRPIIRVDKSSPMSSRRGSRAASRRSTVRSDGGGFSRRASVADPGIHSRRASVLSPTLQNESSHVDFAPEPFAEPFVSIVKDIDWPESRNVDRLHEDCHRGLKLLGNCKLNFYQVMKSMGEVNKHSQAAQLVNDAEHFFDIAAIGGATKTVSREVLEESARRFISKERMEVVSHLYPDAEGGITTITEMLNYITDVAQTINKSPGFVLENLEHHLSISSAMQFINDVRSEGVQLVYEEFRTDIRHTFGLYSQPVDAPDRPRIVRKGSTPSAKKIEVLTEQGFFKFVELVNVNLGSTLDSALMGEVYRGASKFLPVMDEFGFEVLIVSMCQFINPSPFTPMHVKLRALLVDVFQASSDYVKEDTLQNTM